MPKIRELSYLDKYIYNFFLYFQRPKDKTDMAIGVRLRSLSQRGSRENSICISDSAASIELPIFGDADDDSEDINNDDNYNTSSPEQRTVMPKRETLRPNVQNLFQDPWIYTI